MSKRITIQELRTLITEAMNEDAGPDDADTQELEHEGDEDMAAANADQQAANELKDISDEVLLERWKKLAGILRD